MPVFLARLAYEHYRFSSHNDKTCLIQLTFPRAFTLKLNNRRRCGDHHSSQTSVEHSAPRTVFPHTCRHPQHKQGRIQKGQRSSNEGTSIVAPQAPRGWIRGGCLPPNGELPERAQTETEPGSRFPTLWRPSS